MKAVDGPRPPPNPKPYPATSATPATWPLSTLIYKESHVANGLRHFATFDPRGQNFPKIQSEDAARSQHVAAMSQPVCDTDSPVIVPQIMVKMSDVADVARRRNRKRAEGSTRPPTTDSDFVSCVVIAPAHWFGYARWAAEPPLDQPFPRRRGRTTSPGRLFLHFCPTCGAWGAYGYDTAADRPGTWYCSQHRPDRLGPIAYSES